METILIDPLSITIHLYNKKPASPSGGAGFFRARRQRIGTTNGGSRNIMSTVPESVGRHPATIQTLGYYLGARKLSTRS